MKKFISLILICCSLQNSSGYRNRNHLTRKTKVCVIGAGASGISATRHLAKYPDEFEITVFEKTSEVGGTWVYTDKTGTDDHGYPIHSSMYKNLRTNVPKEIMNFPDWPVYQGVNTSCVLHHVILGYLKNYTDHFDLRQFIQFNTVVENVKLGEKNGFDEWKVTVKNLQTFESKKMIFDAVIVCNGHFFKPNIPQIPGLKNFTGKVLHSHDYRDSEHYRNKTVLLLGGGISGIDIGQELVNVASKVYLSHHHPKIPVRLNQTAGVDRFESGKFILKDDSTIDADVLIFCTGYNYAFPFLDNNTEIMVDNGYVSPLYKHMFNVRHPTMAFIGIPNGLIPFPMFQQQAQYIVSYLRGTTNLPPVEIQWKDSKLKTEKKKHAHNVYSWAYIDDLAEAGNFLPIPLHYMIAYNLWSDHWTNHYNDFKNYNLYIEEGYFSIKVKIYSQENFKLIQSTEYFPHFG